jgi:hypothetical protein
MMMTYLCNDDIKCIIFYMMTLTNKGERGEEGRVGGEGERWRWRWRWRWRLLDE